MLVDSTLIYRALTTLGLLAGSGFVMKVVRSSSIESLRATFITKDEIETLQQMYFTKEETRTAFATQEDVKTLEKRDIDAREAMWLRIAESILAPLQRVTDRLDDLFTKQESTATKVDMILEAQRASRH